MAENSGESQRGRDGPTRRRSAAGAARGDPNLMQGEDPRSRNPSDARTWIRVYEQLIDFKHRLLGDIDRELERMPEPLHAIVRDDMAIIQEQLDRYQGRAEYWYARQLELEDVMVDEATRTITHRGSIVQLTTRELQLLQTLLSQPGRYLTARQLVVRAWGDGTLTDEELRMYIATLRQKLRQIHLGQIANRRGRGYVLLLGRQDQPA